MAYTLLLLPVRVLPVRVLPVRVLPVRVLPILLLQLRFYSFHTGCLQLLEIAWNLKSLLEILEISCNLVDAP